MPAQTPLNVSPYYDDFDVNKNFHRILFKAGTPVQARELTQSQTILQDQIERLASQFFVDGDVIVPGEFNLTNPAAYVRLSQITQGTNAAEYIGYKLTGATSGVKATVMFAVDRTETDDTTFYVSYEDSGENAEYKTFLEGETLETTTPNRYTAVVGINDISRPVTSPAIGSGTLFKVNNGSYYVNGFIVRCEEQTVIVDKFGTRPDKEVGFVVSEDFVTSTEDPSLLDNSQGSSNFAAPGADRLRITLNLKVRNYGDTDPNFIMLAKIVAGNIQGKVDKSIKWQWLYDILATRTFDESGDYIVRDFPVVKMEYYNTEDVDGLFNADENDLYPPVPGSGVVDPISLGVADETYVLKVDPGKAYVQGYECGFENHVYVYGDKPREVTFESNNFIKMTEGKHFAVTHVYGQPDIQTINAGVETQALSPIISYRVYNDGYLGDTSFNRGNRPLDTFHIITDGPIGTINSLNHEVIYQGTNSAVVTSPNFDITRGYSVDGGTSTVLYALKMDPVPSGVVHSRYFTKVSTLTSDGENTYNNDSTYNMGVASSTYFTEFVIIPDIVTINEDWVEGELIYGETSGALGTIESGSTDQILVLSNIIGVFQPGETVYQERKSATIIRDGEVTGFAFVEGQADLSNVKVITANCLGEELQLFEGNHFTFDGYNLVPNEDGRQALREFPFLQDDEDDTVLEYNVTAKEGDISDIPNMTEVASGYAVVPTLKITNTITKTKSFYSTLDPNSPDEFSADISTRDPDDADYLVLASGSLFSGAADSNVLECQTLTGDASNQLVSGDIVAFTDNDGNEVRKMVHFVTKPFAFSGNRSACKIYLTTTLEVAITSRQIERQRIKSTGVVDEGLIYRLPQNVVASIESDPLNTRISYTSLKEFVISVNLGASEFEIITNRANETFVPDIDLYTASIVVHPSNIADEGKFIALDPDISLEDNNRKATIRFDYNFTGSAVIKVVAPIFVENAHAKRKEIQRNQILVVPQAEAAAYPVVSMGVADVHRINSITMNGQDVTDRYEFDNGQRLSSYELSRLTRTSGGEPTGDLIIDYDYFKHINEGDFFSVDSYTSGSDFAYRDIPEFEETVQSQLDRNILNLRDALDFRPVVNTLGPNKSVIATITDGVDRQSSTNYDDVTAGGNAHVPRFPVPNSYFKCDVQYYLPKIDSLFLDKSGELLIVSGKSGKSPKNPAQLSSGIRLYDIILPAFTFDISDVRIKKYHYKRFQMKDIAQIEKRVDRLEDLVALSILEQSAINFNVRDAVTGLDRFKNGILVDNFTNHSKGFISSQYRNSVDPRRGIMRSAHFTDQVELEESQDINDQRVLRNYRNNGSGFVTLDYDNVDFVGNPFATRSINLQPYSVFTYTGNLALVPEVDTWSDTRRLPDLVIEDNTVFDALNAFSDAIAETGLGTFWGEWETGDLISTTTQTVNTGRTGRWQFFGTDRVETFETSREQLQEVVQVETATIQNTSYGDRVTDVQVSRTMRSIPVQFTGTRLKPNTRMYLFFDGVDVNAWVSPDVPIDDGEGGLIYTGTPGSTNSGFGDPMVTDDHGNISGVFLIPNGRPPVEGSVFTLLEDVEYQTSGPTRSFGTGTRNVRLTSDRNDNPNTDVLDAQAERVFTSSGVVLDKQETITSVRVPEIFLGVEATGLVETGTTQVRTRINNWAVRRGGDPIAQTFRIDPVQFPSGIFVTELETYFEQKDEVLPVTCYLTTTEGSVPTDTIIPLSQTVLQPDSTLRVVCTLGTSTLNQTTIRAGVTVRGETSGATGVVKTNVIFEAPTVNTEVNVTNTVYNLILDNYDGTFIPGEVIVNEDPLAISSNDLSQFRIVDDEIRVKRVDVRSLGKGYGATIDTNGDIDGYDSTLVDIEFSQPQLPGGVAATGTCKVDSQGRVYDAKLTNSGSGYISTPSAMVVDNGLHSSLKGDDAVLEVRVEDNRKAVTMGVATSDDASVKTVFTFPAPVYLQSDQLYAFVLFAPNSIEYKAYVSKMGENIIGTQTRVIDQPLLGSLFKSQDATLWTEDQTSDITFNLRRASFLTNTVANIELSNVPFNLESIGNDPIETNSNPGIGTAFGDNPSIVKIYRGNHGLHRGDLCQIKGVTGQIGGIDAEVFNDLHEVTGSHFDYFFIQIGEDATSSERGGGTLVQISHNKPYEVMNINTGAMVVPGTSLDSEATTANGQGISGFNSTLAYVMDTPTDVKLVSDTYFETPRICANYINEANNSGGTRLQGQRSLNVLLSLATTDESISPVVDIQRTNPSLTRNLIENFSPLDPIFGPSTRTITFNDSFNRDDIGSTMTIDGTSAVVKRVHPNVNKVVVSTDNKIGSNAVIEGALSGLGIRSTTETLYRDFFVDETQPNGSAYAKWISRVFNFENSCDGIELRLTSIFYNVQDIKCYYKLKAVGFDGDIANENWIPFNPSSDTYVTDDGEYAERKISGLADNVNKIKPRSLDTVDPQGIQPSDWQSLTFSAQGLARFDGVAIKIVMNTDNPCQAPLIDDFILICSE